VSLFTTKNSIFSDFELSTCLLTSWLQATYNGCICSDDKVEALYISMLNCFGSGVKLLPYRNYMGKTFCDNNVSSIQLKLFIFFGSKCAGFKVLI